MVLLGVICLWFAAIVLIVGLVSRASRALELSSTTPKLPSTRRAAPSSRRLTTPA